MNTLIVFGAKYLIYLAPILLLIAIALTRGRTRVRFVILTIIALPLAYVLAKIGSHFYYDVRPFVVGNFTPLVAHAPDNGFPSDHMLLASACAAVASVYKPRYGVALWIIAALVGAARVAAGVHHPVDILGSAVFAVLATAIVWGAMRLFHSSREHDTIEAPPVQ